MTRRPQGVRARFAAALFAAILVLPGAPGAGTLLAADPSPSASPVEQPEPSAADSTTAPPSTGPASYPTVDPTPLATGISPEASPDLPSPDKSPEEVAGPRPVPSRDLGVGDVVARRTESSQTFDNGNGMFTTQFFSQPVFYKPEGAADFQKIEVGFAPTTTIDKLVDAVPVAKSEHAPTAVSLFDSSRADFVTVTHDSYSIGFGLPAADKGLVAAPVTDGIAADYRNMWPGVDLRVLARPMGSKAFVVLHEVPNDASWTFRVDSPGLTLVPQDDGTIDISDANGKSIAYIPRPYAVDSNVNELRGGGVYTDKAAVALGKDVDGAPTITVSVDAGWLAKATYPVYVDPTTVFKSTNNSFDAHTASNYSSSNYHAYQRPDAPNYYEMWLGVDPSGTSGTSYDYIQWDVSAIAGSKVDGVTVSIFGYHQYYNAPTEIRSWIQRVNTNSGSAWTESAITWANQPGVTTAGNIALVDSIEGQLATSNNTSALRSAVQDWVSGIGLNNGLRIWEDGNGSTYWKRIVATEDADTSKRISLNVDWHVPTVTDTTPAFTGAMSWIYGDSGSIPQAKFHVDIAASQANLGTTNVATSGDVSSAATSWQITPGTLVDGTAYWYRIRVSNGTAWSAWSTPATFTYDAYRHGDESYYQSVPFDLGGGLGLDVGTHNGEARLSRTLFGIPTFGPSAELNLSYQSLEPSTAGRFGAGWNSNLTQYLTFATGMVVWHRPDGGRVAFMGTGTTWTVAGAHSETLAYDGTAHSYSVTTRAQTRYVFADVAPGRLARVEDRFGKSLSFSWSTSSATVTDAAGAVTTVTIDSVKNVITTVVDSAGRKYSFGYSSANDLCRFLEGAAAGVDLQSLANPCTTGITSTREQNVPTSLSYDASHHLTAITRLRTSASGAVETITWSIGYTSGKVTSVLDPIGAATSGTPAHLVAYAAGSTSVQLLKTYPALVVRNTTTYTLDAFGRATSVADPNGYTTKRSFDLKSNLLSIDRPLDLTPIPTWAQQAFTYDPITGNVWTETHPEANSGDLVTSVMTYNTSNDLMTRSENDNWPAIKLVTLNQYDGAGHLIGVVENCTSAGATPPTPASVCAATGTHDASTNLTTTYTYTANNQVDVEWNPRGYATKHQYDMNGNQTATIANCTSTGTTTPGRGTTCSAAGTVDSTTNVTSAVAFNLSTLPGKAGLATSETDPMGATSTYAYDGLGRRTSEVMPGDGTIPVLTSTTAYDEFGDRLTETESWPGLSPSHVTTSVYDLRGRLISETDPAGAATSTTYDAAGNATSSTAGAVTTMSVFDGLGHVTSETIGSGGDALMTTHTYDGQGDETQAAAAGSGTDKTVDFRSRITRATVRTTGGPPVVDETQTFDHLGHTRLWRSVLGVPVQRTDMLVDRLGRQVSVATGPVGSTSTSTTAFDANGNATAETGPAATGAGTLTTTVYDALDRPKVVVANDVAAPTDPHQQDLTTTTSFDAAGRAIAVMDPAGVVSRTFYNPRGLAWKTIANCTDSGTSPPANPATCAGAGTANADTNVVTTTTFDGAGNLLTTTKGTATGPAVTANTYDAAGHLTKVIVDQGALNLTTEYGYDLSGTQVATKDPRGTITRTFNDTAGRVTKTVSNCTNTGTSVPSTGWETCAATGTADATWNVATTYHYDGRGNKDKETAPNGKATTFGYDAADRMTSRIDNWVASPTQADQNLTTYIYYDDAGRQAAIKTPTDNRTTFSVTRYLYDTQDRPTNEIRNCTNSGTTTPPDPTICSGAGTRDASTNIETITAYDDHSNKVAVTAPDPSATSGSSTAVVTTEYAYDGQDRLCRVLETAQAGVVLQSLADPCSTAVSGTTTTNISTRYTYDASGNLLTMVDARSNTTAYGYDKAGRMTSLLDAAGKTLAWAYDVAANRTSQTNRTASQSVAWAYDKADRIVTRIADGVTVTYGFDADGNQTSAGDGNRTISSTYDRLNRPLAITTSDDAAAPTSYIYSLTSPTWSDPSGSYSASLDKYDRQIGVTDPIHPGSPFTIVYRADGQPLSVAAPNGNTTAYGYDIAGQPMTSTTTGTGGVARAAYTWTQNRAGNRLSEGSTISGDPANGTTIYAYDSMGRLTTYTPPAAIQAQATTWQAAPNRATLQLGSGTTVTTSYDATNRPTTDTAGATFASDDDGRLTAKPGQLMTYDSLGRLLTATGGGVTTTYAYDPLDRLRTVTRSVPGTVQRFRYVGLTTSAAQVLDGAGAVIRTIANDWAGNRLVDWTGSGSNQRFYGTNGHSDVTWTADGSGIVNATLRYDPWGITTAFSGSNLPDFRFQGSWFDATTSLSWVVSRWYAPSLGRFMSEDSLLGEAIDPPSRHLYAYAAGEPIARVDPDGERWCTRCTATLLYHGAQKKVWSKPLNNPLHARGAFKMTAFIRKQWVPAPLTNDLKGDWRDYWPGFNCLESRACIEVDFDRKLVTVTVQPSCERRGSSNSLYNCKNALDINAFWPLVNSASVNETPLGKVTVSWSLNQSITWGFVPIDGRLELTPPGGKDWYGRAIPSSVRLLADGYPSVELWYRNVSYKPVYRDYEGTPLDLGPGFERDVRMSWPSW